ncbi:TPA: hypothetical protein EYP37_02510 [Candidatus Poribacteria bacterium]|nr:hypothetical protein [Candidatus Poribacteria bacterium]
MYYLIIHLYQDRFQDDVMLALTAEGVGDGLIIDAVNMRDVLAFEMPIFAGFRADLSRRKIYAKLILAVVPDEETIDRIAETLKLSGVNIDDPEICRIAYFPVRSLR